MCHSAFQSHWGQTRQVMGDVKAKYLRKILVDSAKEITPYLHPLLTPPRIGGSHNSSPHKSLIPSKLQRGPKENPRILQFCFFFSDCCPSPGPGRDGGWVRLHQRKRQDNIPGRLSFSRYQRSKSPETGPRFLCTGSQLSVEAGESSGAR